MKRNLIWCLAALLSFGLAYPAAYAQQPKDIPAPEDVAAPPVDAIKTESGLAYKKLTVNDAGKPIIGEDIIRRQEFAICEQGIHYMGWTTDGNLFSSSVVVKQPVSWSEDEQKKLSIVDRVIPGIKEALTLAKVGEKIRVWIPEKLTSGSQPRIPKGMLVLEFEVLEVTPTMPPKDIPADAIKLNNGIAYKIVKTDPNARKLNGSDFVTIEYTGWTQADGKRFQSSIEYGGPTNGFINFDFPLWKSVLTKAHEGDVVQMWVPQRGKGWIINGKKLNGTLIYELTVVKATVMPKTPKDVAAPPANAIKTASGLASKVLQRGTGTKHPTEDSTVRINYTGWTTDGNIFDSNIPRGQALSRCNPVQDPPTGFGVAEFPLDNDEDIIAGLTEGIQLMVVGEKRRFWIPEKLAYDGEEGRRVSPEDTIARGLYDDWYEFPKGMLVFDVELLGFRAGEGDMEEIKAEEEKAEEEKASRRVVSTEITKKKIVPAKKKP